MTQGLEFTRDGTRLAVRSPSGLHIVSIANQGPTLHVPIANIHDVLAVGGQIWVAAGDPTQLHRLTPAGERIAPPVALGPGAGRLRRTAGSELAAAWTAPPPAMWSVHHNELTTVEIPGEPDCIIPVSAARWILCQRDKIVLRESVATRWTTSIGNRSDRVVDGAVLFDGRSVALLVESSSREPPTRQLVVLGLYDPVVQHRLTLTSVDDVRFAPLRGFALLHTSQRMLLIDLRFGRVLKEHDLDREIAELAIDDAAQHIALRYLDDEVIHLEVSKLLAATNRQVSVAADPTAIQPVVAPAAEIEPPEPDAPSVAFHHGTLPLVSARALSPRPTPDRTSRAQTTALLDRYRVLASALVGRAIASAWDHGRLTFPTEGGLPFRTEVVGLLGRTSGIAATDVQNAERDVADAIAAVRAAEVASGPAIPPLEALAREFELPTIAQMILIVVAGPALWGELARLYAILANDENRPLVDELLVHQILGTQIERHDLAQQLDRDAPLIRHGILHAGEGHMRPFIALTAEPIVLRLLRGVEADTDIHNVRSLPAKRTFDQLYVPASVKDVISRELSTPRKGPARIVIRGRTGSGRHTVLATAAEAAGRRLGVIDATPILRDLRNRVEQLGTALRRAHLLGLLPCVDGLESIATDDQIARDTIRDVLRNHPGPLAIRLPWDGTAPLDPDFIPIDLPALTIQQRVACWHEVLAAHRLEVSDPAELAIRYSVGPGVIDRVCAKVAALVQEDSSRDVATTLDTAIRQHLESRLTTTATRVTRLATWSKVVLPPDTLDSLLELIARIKHRRTVFETWGFDATVSTSRGVTALFQGGPGTGKTLAASAIASELGMDLYRVDVARIMSKWIGETEQNLAKLFDAAEDGHAIVLFDEADSLFARRTEVRSSVDRYANLEVNYLLQRLDTFEGIAILTTNFGTSIDAAFKRRLSFRLTFPFPDEEMREMLWRAHLPKYMPTAGEFDLAALARRYRLSGGYIRNAALRAAFRAAEEHVPLTHDHLERAIRAEFSEIGKLADSGILE